MSSFLLLNSMYLSTLNDIINDLKWKNVMNSNLYF